ncbi:cytochrome d ubiquinol oxidase subunit II [Streptomyces sp. HUAS TT7]|uniref:cytochrome d ubiquinol oxidase subunit II n=1 Tax=Streptomyces sp. HUAS TT7 TaxID=3447507 RepID=UPI003F65D42E
MASRFSLRGSRDVDSTPKDIFSWQLKSHFLLHPFALPGGVTTLTLCLFHGAVFLALRTEGSVRRRSRRAASALGVMALTSPSSLPSWHGWSGRTSR